MKFTTSKEALLRVLSVAQDIITNKSPVSILSNVLLETDKENNRVYIKCTNSTVKAITYFGADIYEEGATTVFCDKLLSVISSLPIGDVEFESNDMEILIKPTGKKVKFKIKSLASDKFPLINGFNADGAISIAAKDLRTLIKHSKFAVSTDNNRYMMTGCYLVKNDNYLTMIATDGRRMSVCSCTDFNPDFTPAIIPTKILDVIEKVCSEEGNILINSTDKEFFFKGCGFELSTSLIDGSYPAWQKVLPDGLDHTVTVSKRELEDALKRTVIMAAKNGRVQLGIDKDKVIVSSPESEVGSSKEELSAIYQSEPAEIALNAQYLTDVLKVIDCENIAIDFKFTQENKVSTAIIVKDADTDKVPYTHVIMPMNF